MKIAITHIGTATTLIEIGGVRVLTDPALDPAGRRYSFGFGTGSTKTQEPATVDLSNLDVVLISHDQHADNLDEAGRALLPSAKQVVTTPGGAKRLGLGVGLDEWATVAASGLRITATPARHGPPLSRPIVGHVIGFLIDAGQKKPLYISGDTVYFGGIEEIARRTKVGAALLHLGGVRFGISGPLRYTFNGAEAARAAKLLEADTIVPLHYDGWEHFREPRDQADAAFGRAGLTERVRWLPRGVRTELQI